MDYVNRMNPYQRKHVLNGKAWTEVQRINYKYAILSAQRSKMADDSRKKGIMLERLRVLEARMRRLNS